MTQTKIMIEITANIHDSVIKETLNRIGIATEPLKRLRKNDDGEDVEVIVARGRLYPSVYLYKTDIDGEEKKFLIHFKEYYQITRGEDAYNNISNDDMSRLKYIAGMLRRWGMIDCDPRETIKKIKNVAEVKVLTKQMSKSWIIIHKIKF